MTDYEQKRDDRADRYANEHVEASGGGSFFNKKEASFYSYKAGHDQGYTEGKEAAFRAVVELIREVSTQEQDIFSKNDYVRYLLANKEKITKGSE